MGGKGEEAAEEDGGPDQGTPVLVTGVFPTGSSLPGPAVGEDANNRIELPSWQGS